MIGFVPWYGGFHGSGEGSVAEYQLKIATLYYEKLIHHWWSGTKEENIRMIESMSRDYKLDINKVVSAWISIEDVAQI